MSKEELEAAVRDKTWLIHTRWNPGIPGSPLVTLKRATILSGLVWVNMDSGRETWVYADNLRPATANELLSL